MKKTISSFLLIAVLFIFASCNTNDINQTNDSVETTVTPLEELIETDNFRPGALEHILKGELNRNNQAVGFHYERLPNAIGEVINGSASSKDDHGVYEAKVIVKDVKKKSNNGKSTFFPKNLDSQDVVNAINEAYENKMFINGNTYEGLSEEGITIRMYLDDQKKIISAFPQYEGR